MNSVPLVHALPWSDDENLDSLKKCMILVSDTSETEGRFMLHTLASQFLSLSGGGGSSSGRVLWLACGPSTDKQVATALKKMGCDAAAAYLRSSLSLSAAAAKSTSRADALKIIPMTQEIAVELAGDNVGLDENLENMPSCNEEKYIKGLIKRVKLWLQGDKKNTLQQQQRRDLIIVDDASTLATLLGEYIAYAFIQKIQTLATANNACFLVRCSNDVDVETYMTSTDSGSSNIATTSMSNRHAKGSRDWVGAGSNNYQEQVKIEEEAGALLSCPPWERSLVEMADGIVDVLPLLSGFSREAHGRIIFTERLGGRGWTSSKSRDLWKRRKGGSSESFVSTGSVVNYRCSDNCVMAFHLRSGS